MGFWVVFWKMVELLMIMGIGWGANKFGIIDKTAREKISRMLIDIALPAVILASMFGGEPHPRSAIFMMTVTSVLILLFMTVLTMILSPLIAGRGEMLGTARFAGMFGNVIFMGYPVTTAVFGKGALFWVTIFVMWANIFMYTVGIWMLSSGSGRGDGMPTMKRLGSILLAPTCLSSIAAIVIALFPFDIPDIALSVLSSVGGITTPVSMLVIGSALADIDSRSIFTDLRVFLISAVRLAIIPLTVWFALRTFMEDRLMAGILTMISSMPVASIATLLCIQYGGNDLRMSQVTFITTLLSALSIPMMAWIVMKGN